MIGLDANVVIRIIEGTDVVRAPIEARLAACHNVPGSILSSRLARMECLVLPMRTGDTVVLGLYDAFFRRPEVVLYELTPAVVDKATELRARLRFKTPDALHLATAILAGVSSFLTADRTLARCTEITVEVL